MNTHILKQKSFKFIWVAILMVTFGIQSMSYAQEAVPTITASVEAPLTEANLNGSVITLTLTGRKFTYWVEDALSVSGIDGITIGTFDVDRISDTQVTVELTFSGNIDTDTPLVFTVGAEEIEDYDGAALTAQVPVTAVAETLVATTAAPLTEAGGVVTLTLSGRRFAGWWGIRDHLSVSDIEGATVVARDFERISDTEVGIELIFSGDFSNDVTLSIKVGADAILAYNKDLTVQLPVTAVEESLTASTEFLLIEEFLNEGEIITAESPSLTEENLHAIRLTLTGRQFVDSWSDFKDALTFSSPDGRIVEVGDTAVVINGEVVDIDNMEHLNDIGLVQIDGGDRVSDTEVVIYPFFHGDLDTDAILTLTVGADAILGYNKDFTFEFPVTAAEESLTASTEFSLTEENLNGASVKLSLNGRQLWGNDEDALTISGIEGVTIEDADFTLFGRQFGLGDLTIILGFDGDFDTDATLTITVDAPLIVGYSKGFTVELPVTAIQQSNATVSVFPASVVSPNIGEELTLSLNITGGENVAGFQATVWFDDSAFTLQYDEDADGNYLPAVAYGDYLPDGAFFTEPSSDWDWQFDRRGVTFTAITLAGVSNGDGTLANLTLNCKAFRASTVTLSDVYLVDKTGTLWETQIENGEITIPPEPAEKIVGDINRDGIVNIQDLMIVSVRLGQRGHNSADINGDGIVNIIDLVLVANAFGADAAAPSLNSQVLELLTAADVKEWLTQAQKITLTDSGYRRGISVLEQLHKALTPEATALLANYPNPFNPETWIPYHLSKDADVTLHIYAVNGTLVRTLMLGHQTTGIYQSRARAAHWDGKNAQGEPVASGVYFYTLTAGDFTATRKMLIMK